jgi:alpha-1,6-mannosyltransferase
VSGTRRAAHRQAPPQLWYLGLCVALGAGMVVQTSGQHWSGDYWAHRAAVLELSHDPWSPDHPFTGSDVPDPGLSPYTLVLGLAARSPLGVADVLSIAALFNVVLFLVGLRRFVGCFSKATLAPFWTLIATLFLWGPEAPWRWSGYLNANSIGFGLPYPSMFATALLFFALTALINFCDGGDRRQLAALVVLAPLATLSHPFTGAAMGVAGLALVVSRLGAMPARRIGELAGASAVVGAAVVAWPLYPALGLLGASGRYDGVHSLLYRLVGPRTVLALVALPVLAVRFRANHRDPLALMAGGATVIFILGKLTDRYSLGRILPLGMLALHVALGVWLAERAPALWRQGTGTQRLGSALAAGAVLVAGVFGCRAGLARAVPRLLLPSSVADDPRLETGDAGLSFLGRETSPGDVALVATREAARVSPALGAKVVAPGYIAPFIEDVDRRYTDVAQFFRSPSAGERQVIIERYGVSFVLFDLRFETPDRALGTVVHRDDRYVLVAVTARPTMP